MEAGPAYEDHVGSNRPERPAGRPEAPPDPVADYGRSCRSGHGEAQPGRPVPRPWRGDRGDPVARAATAGRIDALKVRLSGQGHEARCHLWGPGDVRQTAARGPSPCGPSISLVPPASSSGGGIRASASDGACSAGTFVSSLDTSFLKTGRSVERTQVVNAKSADRSRCRASIAEARLSTSKPSRTISARSGPVCLDGIGGYRLRIRSGLWP